MTEERLDDIQRRASHRELRRERVAQDMPSNDAQSGLSTCLGQPKIQSRAVERLGTRIREHVTSVFFPVVEYFTDVDIKGNMTLAVALRRVKDLSHVAVRVPYCDTPIYPIN